MELEKFLHRIWDKQTKVSNILLAHRLIPRIPKYMALYKEKAIMRDFIMPNEVKSVLLNKFKFGTNWEIDKENLMLSGNEFELEVMYEGERLMASLHKSIYGQKAKAKEVRYVEVPINWFQHLKKDVGLKYKTKRVPVKFDLDVYALFPKLKGHEPVIKIE